MPAFRPDAVVLHPDVEAAYDALAKRAAAGESAASVTWKAFVKAVDRVRTDAQWGEVIRKPNIPAGFRRRYRVQNLYCIDLPGFRRCFYTIEGRTVVFLDLVDHDTYDHWFPNRGR